METTTPGLFAVGDGAGVAGSAVAVQEGRIAGITAAAQAVGIDPAEADRRRAGAHEGTHAPPQMPKSFLNFAMASNAMVPKLADDLRELARMEIEYDRNSLLFLMYDDGDEAFC